MNQKIIAKLKKWIEPLSVNQVMSIVPEILQKELNISAQELLDAIDLLYKERVVRYRYKFKCDRCNNDCIAYEKELKAGVYSCSECGKMFSIGDMPKIGYVVYEFDKNELMNLWNYMDVDFTKAAMGTNIVNIGIHREWAEGGYIMEDSKKKKIFFGSSTEAVDTMDEIAALVSSLEYETITWNSPNKNVFIAGDSILDSLIETSKNVDAAIFIFNDDDKTWCRDGVQRGTVRDNVLFEYGLFMGALGKQRVIFASKNKPKLASDLAGVTYIDANVGEAQIRQSLKAWLRRIL